MAGDVRHVDVACRSCAWRDNWGLEAVIRHLAIAGKIRRSTSPDPDVLFELLFALADELVCPSCNAPGLIVTWGADEADGWGDAPLCEDCGRMIPAERIEAVPDATLCVACQGRRDRGEPPEPREDEDFCPRCGAPIRVEARNDGGVTRYRTVCTGRPPCRLGG